MEIHLQAEWELEGPWQGVKVRPEVFGEPGQEGITATSMPVLVFRAVSRWQGSVSVQERTFSGRMMGGKVGSIQE